MMVPSPADQISMVKSPLMKSAKKIEEDYSMFDEARDDELEDIIEEEIEDDSEEIDAEDGNPDMMLTSHEEREERKARKEELRTLKTALLTIREKLQMKTIRIEDIKDTLKKSQMLTKSFKDGTIGGAAGITGMDGGEIIIEEVVKEYENQEPDEDENVDLNEDDDEDSTHDENAEDNGENDEDDDDGMDNGMEEIDPQVLKLQERVKFLRHRCVSSLGNQIFEKAYHTYKSIADKSADEIREQLIKILGEESIGFWAIMDQIMFFENILDEISTVDSSS
jgi:hypothetical protein